jgi:phosphoglycerate dehydrogenase-like enzyme
LYTTGYLPDVADCPNLELIQFTSAGINHIVRNPIYTDTDITLATASGIHGPQISEWVIMTALIQIHKYNDLYEAQKKHQWGGYNATVNDLTGQRIGILGYGSIGRQGWSLLTFF